MKGWNEGRVQGGPPMLVLGNDIYDSYHVIIC